MNKLTEKEKQELIGLTWEEVLEAVRDKNIFVFYQKEDGIFLDIYITNGYRCYFRDGRCTQLKSD